MPKGARNQPKGPGFTDEQFVQAWMKAYKEGNGTAAVAEELICSQSWVSTLAVRFRKQGVKLPFLQHRQNTRRVPKDVDALNALVAKEFDSGE